MNHEETIKINEFLKWLDGIGVNYFIISAIRKMLLKGIETRPEEIDFNDELTGEIISGA